MMDDSYGWNKNVEAMRLGKRSQQRMTGLSSDQRIKRSLRRKEKEEKQRARDAVELTKAMLGLPQLEEPEPTHKHEDVWELPMPPGPAISPGMRQLIQLEKERKEKKKGWLDEHG